MAKKILSRKEITDLTKIAVKEARKDKIFVSEVYLFGSYAKNKAKTKSDLDLCFVFSKKIDPPKTTAIIRTKFYRILEGISMDILAYSKKDFKDALNPLAFEIRTTGKRIL